MLPFGGQARFVDTFVADGPIQTASNTAVFEMPYVTNNLGAKKSESRFTFGTAVKGRLLYQVRIDNPL